MPLHGPVRFRGYKCVNFFHFSQALQTDGQTDQLTDGRTDGRTGVPTG